MASGEDPLLKYMEEDKNEPKTKDEVCDESTN